MLVEFRFKNFRSFYKEQALSFVASNYDKSLKSHLIPLREVPGFEKTSLLKAVALYGANASGKSNVLQAAAFMVDFVNKSAADLKPGDPTGVVPFALAPGSAEEPTEFEMTMIIDGIRHQYAFAATRERVVHEILVAYPKKKAQRWFERKWNGNAYEWTEPTEHFRHDMALRDRTRENALFLSTGAQWNHQQLTTVYQWFKNQFRFMNLDADVQFGFGFTAGLLKKKPDTFKRVVEMLKVADLGVVDAVVEEQPVSRDLIVEHFTAAEVSRLEREKKLDQLVNAVVQLKHRASGMEPVAFEMSEESVGTRRFFALAGPWLDILENGYTVFIDELESSLHPLLVKAFLNLLFCPKNNPKGAQVIFTTHNPTLLDNDILRRDQIWFTEKGKDGASSLYPLTDYKPRDSESLEKGYLAGRYGGLPYIPEGLLLAP